MNVGNRWLPLHSVDLDVLTDTSLGLHELPQTFQRILKDSLGFHHPSIYTIFILPKVSIFLQFDGNFLKSIQEKELFS